ncbi:hypothetical protein GCM10007108_02650 [Thermogymnomonas acidicola]|uniref:Uncharacterized protein n=1 Tax=Thermogymnomonas acidicola TaxID=399579 RepID=A0AA37BQ31_9ARCH|nr:hypothetical protein [Thermogymnomonas acidicola]GGM68051.1 hypothetical protein GCM10007108_02650 [Thermogymnomonas acidicola]
MMLEALGLSSSISRLNLEIVDLRDTVFRESLRLVGLRSMYERSLGKKDEEVNRLIDYLFETYLKK